MTPQERQLIDDLFDRLAKLEGAKRDPEAMSAIMQGLRNAPNAVYALVQTVLVQDEALKRADMRIQELEAGAGQQDQGQSGGFLNSMRDAIFGQNQSHGSVPNVRAPEIAGNSGSGRAAWNTGQVLQQNQAPGPYNQPAYGQPQPYGAQQQQPPFGGGGGSFLGTAAAAAVGVVGGSMLAGSLRSMMGGGGNQQSFGDTANHNGGIEDRRPWSDQQPGGDLAREAGINDIGSRGSSGQRADNNDGGSRQGFFDSASNDDDDTDHDSDGFDGDDSDGDSDYA